jgi:hypothetical protein
MRSIGPQMFLSLVLLSAPAILAAQAPEQPHLGRETWYEVMLEKTNASDTNYGQWLEERRQALLDASVRNPFFWYSLWTTVCLSVVSLVLLKLIKDSREKEREHARIEADLRNHDSHSRARTKQAIDRYNAHIEECNRATETAEAGDGRPGWGSSAQENMRAELQRVTSQLEATTQDRNKLQEDLRQKSLVVSDLSLRLDTLSKKVNGNGQSRGDTDNPRPTNGNRDGVPLVGHINHLQEELYAERQKNRRLKGA